MLEEEADMFFPPMHRDSMTFSKDTHVDYDNFQYWKEPILEVRAPPPPKAYPTTTVVLVPSTSTRTQQPLFCLNRSPIVHVLIASAW